MIQHAPAAFRFSACEYSGNVVMYNITISAVISAYHQCCELPSVLVRKTSNAISAVRKASNASRLWSSRGNQCGCFQHCSHCLREKKLPRVRHAWDKGDENDLFLGISSYLAVYIRLYIALIIRVISMICFPLKLGLVIRVAKQTNVQSVLVGWNVNPSWAEWCISDHR